MMMMQVFTFICGRLLKGAMRQQGYKLLRARKQQQQQQNRKEHTIVKVTATECM